MWRLTKLGDYSASMWTGALESQRAKHGMLAGLATLTLIFVAFSWPRVVPVWPVRLQHPVSSYMGRDALLDSVMNETLGFQKIFVINLPSRTDRRDAMTLAASLSGLKVDFIDAVTDIDVLHALPHKDPDFDVSSIPMSNHGSWRSHVNAIRTVVEQNLNSALILEDDADWDIRIKGQLRQWALATRLLVQPIKDGNSVDNETYLDLTFPSAGVIPQDSPSTVIDYHSPGQRVLTPTSSAYGDLNRWDVLWLGHCGQEFAHGGGSGCPKTPLGRVVMLNDTTVAQTQWFDNYWSGNEYKEIYQNHTRVTHWSCGQVCNLGYGISLPGAKKLLYEFGMNQFNGMSDTILREICDGDSPFDLRRCVSVSPPLFSQFDFRKSPLRGTSPNIRLSVKGNARELVNGETEYHDAWPDMA